MGGGKNANRETSWMDVGTRRATMVTPSGLLAVALVGMVRSVQIQNIF